MKNKKVLLRFIYLLFILSFAGFFGCIITALMIQEYQLDNQIWLILALVFSVLFFVGFFLWARFIRTPYYIKIIQERSTKRVKKLRNKNKDMSCSIDADFKYIDINSVEFFVGYEQTVLEDGVLYYKVVTNRYSRRKRLFQAFYVLESCGLNSFDYDKEEMNAKKYLNNVSTFFNNKYGESDFIRCGVIFLHENLAENQQDFYCSFLGQCNKQTGYNRSIISFRLLMYCGISEFTRKAYIHYQSRINIGADVVSFNKFMQHELHLEKHGKIK